MVRLSVSTRRRAAAAARAHAVAQHVHEQQQQRQEEEEGGGGGGGKRTRMARRKKCKRDETETEITQYAHEHENGNNNNNSDEKERMIKSSDDVGVAEFRNDKNDNDHDNGDVDKEAVDIDFNAAKGIVDDDESIFTMKRSSSQMKRNMKTVQKRKVYSSLLAKDSCTDDDPANALEDDGDYIDTHFQKRSSTNRHRDNNNAKSLIGSWFDIPKQELTPSLRNDLRVLKMRSVTDPKRFYKANDSSKLPTNFYIGTVEEDKSEFYSGRLTKKQRKQSFMQEVMQADTINNDNSNSHSTNNKRHSSDMTGINNKALKRRFLEIQEKKKRVVRKRRRNDTSNKKMNSR